MAVLGLPPAFLASVVKSRGTCRCVPATHCKCTARSSSSRPHGRVAIVESQRFATKLAINVVRTSRRLLPRSLCRVGSPRVASNNGITPRALHDRYLQNDATGDPSVG